MARRPRYTLGGRPTSLAEIGRLAGMSGTAVLQRIRAGERPEEIVATGSRWRRHRMHGRPVSADEVGRLAGISGVRAGQRLAAGETPEQIIARPRSRRQGSLAAKDVREIRRLYDDEGWTQAELADRYGVSQSWINAIVRRMAWADLE